VANAFESARLIEAESRRIIEPMLELHTDGRFVYTDKGRLSRQFQKEFGDVLINMKDSGEMLSIEFKAERKSRENLFLEFWSNGSRYTFGWMAHSNADLLFYHFLESDELCIVKMQSLRRWFWFGEGPVRRSGKSHMYAPAFTLWPPKKQTKYSQMNDTWGCCVPKTVIRDQVGMRVVNPLGLFGMEEAA
jgi:hypothetical protein